MKLSKGPAPMASDIHSDNPDRKTSRVLIRLSLALFVASLALPAAHYKGDWHEPTPQIPGWFAFVLGWVPACFNVLTLPHGEFEFLTTIAWFANPLLLGCWLVDADGPPKKGVAFGAGALGLSMVFLACRTISMPDNRMTGVVPGLGYAAWVASIAAALLRAWLIARAGSSSSSEQVATPADQSAANAVREALAQLRNGRAVGIKCPACRHPLTARRTSSANSAIPDIEITYPCGACTELHPF